MGLALHSGVPADVWLDDLRALATGIELLDEADREMKARSRGR